MRGGSDSTTGASDEPSHSTGSDGPSFAMPSHACDCHMHLFDNAYPLAEGAEIHHPNASIGAYRRLQNRLGLNRNVLVQPSSYGLDNRLLVSALAELGNSSRGVAVIDDSVSPDELETLTRSRVTGARFNLVQRGATHIGMLQAVAQRVRPLGWHIQIHMRPTDLVAHYQVIDALPVPVVIDHMARFATEPSIQRSLHECVRALLSNGKTWMKLSGAYLASQQVSPPFSDLSDFVAEMVRDFPTRLVWGSDWPHATEKIKPDDGALLSMLGHWIPDEEVRDQILERNPALLYGF